MQTRTLLQHLSNLKRSKERWFKHYLPSNLSTIYSQQQHQCSIPWEQHFFMTFVDVLYCLCFIFLDRKFVVEYRFCVWVKWREGGPISVNSSNRLHKWNRSRGKSASDDHNPHDSCWPPVTPLDKCRKFRFRHPQNLWLGSFQGKNYSGLRIFENSENSLLVGHKFPWILGLPLHTSRR